MLAETKDHADWELITKVAEKSAGVQIKALKEAADEVEDQEDEHLYHSKRMVSRTLAGVTRNEGRITAARGTHAR